MNLSTKILIGIVVLVIILSIAEMVMTSFVFTPESGR